MVYQSLIEACVTKVKNRLLAEELAYDCEDLVCIHGTLVSCLNVEQKNIYDVVT
jgi:hypothetical protein